MTLAATRQMAGRINKYWEEKGFYPEAHAAEIRIGKLGTYNVIRSNLVLHVPKIVNGKPQSRGYADVSDIPLKKTPGK